jgi:hypothetical protein
MFKSGMDAQSIGFGGSLTAWSKGVTESAKASVDAFTETGKAKDELGDNFKTFSSDVVLANETLTQSIVAVKDAQISASTALEKELGGTMKIISPLLDDATTRFNLWRDSLNEVRTAAYNLRNGLRDTMNEVMTLLNLGAPGPGLAGGGSVHAGQPYIVGEQGPELFVPRSSGTVLNSSQVGGAGGVTVIINGDVTGDEVVQKVREGLLRIDLYNPGSAIARS